MELKYKEWKDINVNTFMELKAVDYNTTDDIDALNTDIEILSILCDCDEEEISNLTATEFKSLLRQTEFLKTMPKVKVQDRYMINGKPYDVFLSLKSMSVSQYIDFQTYYKNQDKYFKELLSVFLIPKGKKYGDGYSVDNVINEIGEHLSIVDAYSILFFFIVLFRSLTKVTLDCSIKDMRKMKKKLTDKEEIRKMEQAIKEMEKARALAKNGLGYIW